MVECQQINVEGVMGLEKKNLHSAVLIMIMNSGKTHSLKLFPSKTFKNIFACNDELRPYSVLLRYMALSVPALSGHRLLF